MYGPQVVAGMVMEKAAELNPARALELMKEPPWNLVPRSAWFRYYVQGLSPGSDWPAMATMLERHGEFQLKAGLTLRFYKVGESPPMPRFLAMGRSNRDQLLKSIAMRWGEENLDESVRWFTSEHHQDFGDPESAPIISQALPYWLQESRFRALDWIDGQEHGHEWRREVLLSYGEQIAKYPPDEHAMRALSMLERREDRRALLDHFMGDIEKPSSTGHVNFRHQADELRPFIQAADINPKVMATMLEMLRTRKWQALPD